MKTTLSRNVPLAVAIGAEKAKSEMIVADVLVELRKNPNWNLYSSLEQVDPYYRHQLEKQHQQQ